MKRLCLIVAMFGFPQAIMGQEPLEPVYEIDRKGEVKIAGYAPKLKESTPAPIKDALPKGYITVSADCGANSLYVFLRLRGVGCNLADIRREVSITERGASMLDLKEAADKHNFKTAVVKSSALSLLDKLPAIARLAATDNPDEGHYVTVVEVAELTGGKKVKVINGSTGAVIEMSSDVFERDFSGYALVADEAQWGAVLTKVNIVLLIITIVELLALAALGWRRWRLRAVKTASRS